MAERVARRWVFHVAVLLGAWAFLFLLHPPPGVLWFDYSWVVYALSALPFSLAGMSEAIRWTHIVHSPALARPLRSVTWWLAAKTLGCDSLGYHIINLLALGIAVWALAQVTRYVTGSRSRGILVAACLAVSYATVYPILYFGFGLGAACAFGGLAAYFGSEDSEGTGRRWFRVIALLLLLLAGLFHETFLAFSLLPLAHAVIARRNRPATLRATVFLSVLALYAISGWLMVKIYGVAVPVVGGGGIRRILEGMPGILVEPARVLFAVLTGGLPWDPLRALPYFPEFARIREVALSPAGLATTAVVLLPTIGLGARAFVAWRRDASARRRIAFCLVWLGLGSVPLMVPVAGPEAFHLTGALPALFLLWTEALWFRPERRRWLVGAAWGLLGLWAGVHLSAQWVLFHRDVPAMSRAAQSLHRILRQAELEGNRVGVMFFPVQIGGHYGMMPTFPPLYPPDGGRDGRCLRADAVRGCLVEPTWVWSSLRPQPPVPRACRAPDGIRVGPLDPAMERELAGSRHMLAQPGAGLPGESEPKLLGVCPLSRVEPVVIGGRPYWLYRVDAPPPTRWYRFSLEPEPALLAVAECDGGSSAPAGTGR